MAFRTNKVPAIEERTVSGSSVSFNSAFALPLKACKVSFSATESGSGTKSPSNPYTISGVSGLNLSANSVPVSVNFGDTYYGGYADLDSKKGFITHKNLILNGSETFTVYGTLGTDYRYLYNIGENVVEDNSNICNRLKTIIGTNTGSWGDCRFISRYFIICDKDKHFNSVDELKTFILNNNIEIVYKIPKPIEIDLSDIPDLSSIIGNNTFSTDTGTLEITFSDLQEKTASGSVASFNTALAMPLPSCKIAVNAWQEGTGDPSPSNVRPIHGFSEVNVTANNVVRTIQLGQEVYGAEVDVVNGVAHVTHAYATTLNKKLSITSYTYSGMNGVSIANVLPTNETRAKGICNMTVVNNDHIWLGVGNKFVYWVDILDVLNMSLEDFKLWIVDHPLEVAYPMKSADQFDIQLTPTQIETLIGNNTIFADTGDVDLTFNDLDLAKRGSFREVFKLP